MVMQSEEGTADGAEYGGNAVVRSYIAICLVVSCGRFLVNNYFLFKRKKIKPN